MPRFASNASHKYSKLARLEIRPGSSGDDILCGVLPDGSEIIVAPERDGAARPGGFILMCRGTAPTTLGADWRRQSAPPTEPYRAGIGRKLAQAGRGHPETAIEAAIRRLLVAIDVRFNEKVDDLPGTPDFHLPDLHAVILANGCFWHAHGCGNVHPPHVATERAEKIRRAAERDVAVMERLLRLGLRVLVVWECATAGVGALSDISLRAACEDFLTGSDPFREIVGRAERMTI
jgi:DNA mismatch endonuclease (patch repair protein)